MSYTYIKNNPDLDKLKIRLINYGIDFTQLTPNYIPTGKAKRCYENCYEYCERFKDWTSVYGWMVQYNLLNNEYYFTYHVIIGKTNQETGSTNYVDITPNNMKSSSSKFSFILDKTACVVYNKNKKSFDINPLSSFFSYKNMFFQMIDGKEWTYYMFNSDEIIPKSPLFYQLSSVPVDYIGRPMFKP